MPNQRKVEALLNAQAKAGGSLLSRLQASLRQRLNVLADRDWYTPTVYEPMVEQFAATSAAAEKARGQVAGKFTQQVLHELGVEVPAGVDVSDLRGVDPLEVWQRPVKEYRYQVSQGKSPAEALNAAVARAEAIADDNLQLADRKAAQDVMAASAKVVGYRRVIHPELSAGGTCGLCVAASTRKYKVSELRAIHERCKCTTLPITKEDDLGDVLNTYDIAKLYADNAGSTSGQQLKYTRYQINEHGELGPVLRRKGDNFKDAQDAADQVGRPAEKPINLDTVPAKKKTRDQAVAELQVLLRADPTNKAAIKAKKAEISRLNRAA